MTTQAAYYENSVSNYAYTPTQTVDALHERYDVTSISLDQLQLLSTELYTTGKISETDHELLSFHMQICSNFDMFTALLGNIMAEPHKHRNFLQIWNNILNLQERDYPHAPLTRHLRHITATLEQLHLQRHGYRYVA